MGIYLCQTAIQVHGMTRWRGGGVCVTDALVTLITVNLVTLVTLVHTNLVRLTKRPLWVGRRGGGMRDIRAPRHEGC